MIRVADRDHSWEGSIMVNQFLQLFSHQGVDEQQQSISEAFAHIAKGDTELDKKALTNIFQALGEEVTEEEIAEFMEMGDLDEDGYINLDDFKNMCNAPDPKLEV